MKCLFSVAAAAVILHGAGLARGAEESAEPSPAQVRSAAEAFDRGREAYKAEEYVEAAEQFESADANAPSPAALELAIRARDKAGQLDRAATLAALALARHPDDPNIQKVAPAIVQRAKLELFEIDLKCDDPCDVTVAGKIVPGSRATERAVFVSPGTYAVRAGWSGDRSLSKSIEASKGAAGTLEFQAPPVAVAPSPVATPTRAPEGDKPRDQGTPKTSGALPATVFWVGVGLTAVATGVTIWSGLDTQSNPGPDKVREACNATPPTDCNTLYDQGRSKQTRTNVLLGVTGGLGVATAVIGAFFTDFGGAKSATPAAEGRASRPKTSFSVQPWLAIGSGASVGALGRF
jgi:hypothetical protein